MRTLPILLLALGCTPKGDPVTEARLHAVAPAAPAARLETATFALG